MAKHVKKSIWREFIDLKRLWPYLRAHKTLLLIAIVSIPVISLLQMLMPMVLKWIVDQGILQKQPDLITTGSILFLVIVVIEYLVRSSQTLITSLAVHRMIRHLRQTLVTHVLSLKASFHDRSMSGALVTRATSDFDNLAESLNQGVLTSVVDCAVLVGCLSGLFILNWKLALCSLIILPVVGGIVSWFSKGLKEAMLDARRKIAALNGYTQECLYNNATIKLLTAERSAKTKYDRLNIAYRDAQMKSVLLDAILFAVIDGISSITIGIIFWLGVSFILSGTPLSAGLFVAFVQFIQQLYEPIKQLGNKMAMLQGAFTSIDRIFGILDIKDFISGKSPPAKIKGRVGFENVSFRYHKDHHDVLKTISFTVEPGQSVALVGKTGGGKSTIIKLLTKLYDGYQGKILIDDQDLTELNPRLLRESISIVPQDIVLFDGSVAFNIGLDRPNITTEDIKHAATAVGADSFTNKLAGQYDFQIKEQGINLSHGQRQLLVFARALANNPNLLILDEATSSVDPESEAIIQSAIEKLFVGRSVIVIAHRLSTIEKCDNILVVDHGQIVEQGNVHELLAKKGHYYHLATALKADIQSQAV